jgi:hypothetical protein
VEEHFLDTKYLLPSCHKGYWIGYKATSWPNFQSLVSSAATGQQAEGAACWRWHMALGVWRRCARIIPAPALPWRRRTRR